MKIRIMKEVLIGIIVFTSLSYAQEKKSAAAVIEKTIRKSGIEAAQNKFEEVRSSGKESLHFDETEFDALGFKLQTAGRVVEAAEVYTMNTELFPESVHARDQSMSHTLARWKIFVLEFS